MDLDVLFENAFAEAQLEAGVNPAVVIARHPTAMVCRSPKPGQFYTSQVQVGFGAPVQLASSPGLIYLDAARLTERHYPREGQVSLPSH